MATRMTAWISGGLAALFLVLTGWLWFTSPNYEITRLEGDSHTVTCPSLAGTSTIDDLSVGNTELQEATDAFLRTISGAEDQVGDPTTPLYQSTEARVLGTCDAARENRLAGLTLSGLATATSLIILGVAAVQRKTL